MMDQLIAIKDKLLAFWNKYTTKQKTIIICVVLAVFFAIVILSYVLTTGRYIRIWLLFPMPVWQVHYQIPWIVKGLHTKWRQTRVQGLLRLM